MSLGVRVIPVLLFQDQGLYKGVEFADRTYVGDPLNAIRIFNAKQAHEVIFLDIAATAQGRAISPELVERLSYECFMPLAAGGGVSTPDQAAAVIEAGAEKVCLNTHALADPGLVTRVAETFGSQSVVAALDAKRHGDGWRVYTHCGARPTGLDPAEAARRLADAGAGEVLLTSIDHDGHRQGYDLELIDQVAQAVTIPVIACGGAGSLAHMAQAVGRGASAVAAGSMFVFHGRRRAVLISFPDPEDIAQALGEAHD